MVGGGGGGGGLQTRRARCACGARTAASSTASPLTGPVQPLLPPPSQLLAPLTPCQHTLFRANRRQGPPALSGQSAPPPLPPAITKSNTEQINRLETSGALGAVRRLPYPQIDRSFHTPVTIPNSGGSRRQITHTAEAGCPTAPEAPAHCTASLAHILRLPHRRRAAGRGRGARSLDAAALRSWPGRSSGPPAAACAVPARGRHYACSVDVNGAANTLVVSAVARDAAGAGAKPIQPGLFVYRRDGPAGRYYTAPPNGNTMPRPRVSHSCAVGCPDSRPCPPGPEGKGGRRHGGVHRCRADAARAARERWAGVLVVAGRAGTARPVLGRAAGGRLEGCGSASVAGGRRRGHRLNASDSRMHRVSCRRAAPREGRGSLGAVGARAVARRRGARSGRG